MPIINGRSEDESVGIGELITDLIADIVIEDAAFVSVGEGFSGHFATATAGNTSANRFVANPYYFGFQPFLAQGFCHLFECKTSVSIGMRASVNKQYFHDLFNFR